MWFSCDFIYAPSFNDVKIQEDYKKYNDVKIHDDKLQEDWIILMPLELSEGFHILSYVTIKLFMTFKETFKSSINIGILGQEQQLWAAELLVRGVSYWQWWMIMSPLAVSRTSPLISTSEVLLLSQNFHIYTTLILLLNVINDWMVA